MISKNILDTCKLVEFIAIDLETTGLVPKEESIIEVSAIKFKNGKEKSTFTYLLTPDKPISPFIEDLTGISNEMVRGKPSFLDILDELIPVSTEVLPEPSRSTLTDTLVSFVSLFIFDFLIVIIASVFFFV